MHKYRITSVWNVETDIIASITVSLIGRALILRMMYDATFKTERHNEKSCCSIFLSEKVCDITEENVQFIVENDKSYPGFAVFLFNIQSNLYSIVTVGDKVKTRSFQTLFGRLNKRC